MAPRRCRSSAFPLLAAFLAIGEMLLVVSPWAAALHDLDLPVTPPGFRTPGQQLARETAADALRRARLAEPPFQDVYVAHPTGEVVVVYQMNVANELSLQPYRTFAERRVLVIRRGLQPLGYRNVRLVIKAPAPDTCVMAHYGEYHLINGRSTWQQMSGREMAQHRRLRGADVQEIR